MVIFDDMKLEKYAEVIWWALARSRREKLKKSDVILVSFDPPALPLAEALFALIHDHGLNPVPRQALSARMERDLYDKANYRRLLFQPPGETELHEHLSGEIRILAPESLRHLEEADPEAVAKAREGRRPFRRIMRRREDAGLFGRTACVWPTEALAGRAGMTLEEYAAALAKTCMLGEGMPVNSWKLHAQRAVRLQEWLNSLDIRSLRLESEGIDLTVTPGRKRRWLTLTGRNMPSYEHYISPNWRGTEGFFQSDIPSFHGGHEVENARIEFRSGQVTRAVAKLGADHLKEQLRSDQGATKLGEFSLTDRRLSPIDRFMAHTLLDENLGGEHGNCHLGLGAADPAAYTGDPAMLSDDVRNLLGMNDSDLHWDLVNTRDRRVTATLTNGSSLIIYEHGQFAVDI